MKRILFVMLVSTAMGACTPQQSQQPQPQPYPAANANDPKPIQDSVPVTSSTIPAQTYYFNPARAGSAGN